MYNKEKMNKALREFNWDAAKSLLSDEMLESVRELLSDVSKSGCLIRLYSLTAEQEQLRKEMIEGLKALCERVGDPSATKYFKWLRSQAKLTELTLSEIDETFNLDPYAELDPDRQAWSALEWAAREMIEVLRQMDAGLLAQADGEPILLDPLTLRVDKESGSGLAAGRMHQLSNTVANTLRMLGHRNHWNDSGNFTIPPRVECSSENLEAAARISRLGDIWQEVLDQSKHHRFWGGHFEGRTPDEEQKEVFPDLEIVVASVTTDKERRDDVQICEYISENRMQRLALSAFLGITKTNARDRVKNPQIEVVALAPNGLVSELEMATFYMLDRHMYFAPASNTKKFAGLTILEWLRGYCVLEKYARELPNDSHGILKINRGELDATLERGGLSSLKAETFIKRLIFKSGRRDLYDAPLLATSDGQIFFFAALYRGIDIAKIIASQIGTEKLNVNSKGKDFEKSVLRLLLNSGLQAKSFHYKIDKIKYDCDVALLWEGNLFIFECKNYSLPTDDPADRLFFWKRQIEAMQQVERIAHDLGKNPEIIRKHFGDEAAWEDVHAVVLNAFCFSLPQSPQGTYFYDASALSRFLEKGTLNQIHSVPISGKMVDVSVPIKRLWQGDRPTPNDLLREMRDPSQVASERDKYYLARKLLRISKATALAFITPASKPPDFEPLTAAEQTRDASEKPSE